MIRRIRWKIRRPTSAGRFRVEIHGLTVVLLPVVPRIVLAAAMKSGALKISKPFDKLRSINGLCSWILIFYSVDAEDDVVAREAYEKEFAEQQKGKMTMPDAEYVIKGLKKLTAMMAEHPLGRTLDEKQVESIVTFLKTLTGELPKDLIAKPELLADGPETPKPKKGSAE
jgi:hypothetical protein